MLALLFLCSFLDRTNVGNAKIYGLEKDLNISDHQYDIGLTVFYLTYVCRYCTLPPLLHPLHIYSGLPYPAPPRRRSSDLLEAWQC